MSWLAGLIKKTHPVYAPGGENKFNQEELASANSLVVFVCLGSPPAPPYFGLFQPGFVFAKIALGAD